MIKVGILGFIHGHVNGFGGMWVKHPEEGISVTAGWDHERSRAESAASVFPDMKVYDSLEEILDSDIDAVVICAETSMHCELTVAAANAGKNIICYKPMCLTLSEADKMVKAVEDNGVSFTLGYQMRVDQQNIKMKEMVRSGELGNCYYYRRRHGLPVHLWNDFKHAWHNDPDLNRDIFADDSSHPIDMLNWFFGVPESVTCEMSTMFDPDIPNDTGVALFKYSTGLIAEISCIFVCSATDITTEIYCSGGSIIQNFGDNPSCSIKHTTNGLKWFKNGDADWTYSDILSPQSHFERICDQYKPFASFLRGEIGPVCSVYEARDSLRMVLSCYLSSREGTRISLNDKRLYSI